MAVAIDRPFLDELPVLPEVPKSKADVAWLIYDLIFDKLTSRYKLTKERTLYTQFNPVLERITKANPGKEADFRQNLERKLRKKLAGNGAGGSVVGLEDVFGCA